MVSFGLNFVNIRVFTHKIITKNQVKTIHCITNHTKQTPVKSYPIFILLVFLYTYNNKMSANQKIVMYL